jgi:Spy/CpxP family protein refolding chaperone
MRKSRVVCFSLITIFLLVSFSEVYAQGHAPRGNKNVRENMFVLRTLRMTQALDLTEAQTAVIFPELNRAEKEKARLQADLAREIMELRQLINNKKVEDREFEDRVAKIADLREKIRSRESEFEKFLFTQLTSAQKARYIIFNIDFNRGMMERMGRARLAGKENK